MCGGSPVRDILQIVRQKPLAPETAPRALLQAAPAAQTLCPTCRTPVQSSFAWCPTCGAALKPQPCAYCGQTLSPEDTACPACGAPRARKAV